MPVIGFMSQNTIVRSERSVHALVEDN